MDSTRSVLPQPDLFIAPLPPPDLKLPSSFTQITENLPNCVLHLSEIHFSHRESLLESTDSMRKIPSLNAIHWLPIFPTRKSQLCSRTCKGLRTWHWYRSTHTTGCFLPHLAISAPNTLTCCRMPGPFNHVLPCLCCSANSFFYPFLSAAPSSNRA